MAQNNNEVAKVAINDIGTEEDFIKAVVSKVPSLRSITTRCSWISATRPKV